MGGESAVFFHSRGRKDSVWLSQMWQLVLGVTFALAGWLALLVWSGWVRPLLRLREQVLALSRGEWNRLLLSEPLPGELWTVLLRLEGLRRALLDRLRSSTELNLQLEGEVARRNADLARRNSELQQALVSLGRARDELLHRERLAAIGSVVASLTSEINNPVGSMVALLEPLCETHHELGDKLLTTAQDDTIADDVRTEALAMLTELRQMVDLLQRGGRRAHDVVRAMRGYVSSGTTTQTTVPLLPLLFDLYQLFAERVPLTVRLRDGGATQTFDLRKPPRQQPAITVQATRSDLSLLISRWLLRTVPRLLPEQRAQIDIELLRMPVDTPSVVLRLADSGAKLDTLSLSLFDSQAASVGLACQVTTDRQGEKDEAMDLTTELALKLPLVCAQKEDVTAHELLGNAI